MTVKGKETRSTVSKSGNPLPVDEFNESDDKKKTRNEKKQEQTASIPVLGGGFSTASAVPNLYNF